MPDKSLRLRNQVASAVLLALAGCGQGSDGPVDTTLPDEPAEQSAAPSASEEARAVAASDSSTPLDASGYGNVRPQIRSRPPEPVTADAPGEVSPSQYVQPRPDLQPRAPMPRGNPGAWVISSDYPPRALREEREGTTNFRLVIDPDGRVQECIVTGSSGHADLDDATCLAVQRRARFNPARDNAGMPITGYYSNRVRWAIPQYVPYEEPKGAK